MTARKDRQPIERPTAVPAQDSEADIVEELRAEPDENGELQVSIEDVRKAGAIDVETIRQNRQIDNVAARRRKGEKVSLSTNDPLVKYAGILKSWPTSTIHVKLRRLNGGPEATEMITSFPRDPTELYDAIRGVHGQCGEAAYEVEFLDATTREWRGKGRITMKDTRAPYQQGHPPNGAPHPGYAPPAPQPMPPPGYPLDPIATLQQVFQMFQQMQAAMQPAAVAAPPVAVMPPPLSPQASPAEQVAWMQQAFQMFQQMREPASVVTRAAPPQVAPQSSLAEAMGVLQQAFQMVQQMQPQAPVAPLRRTWSPGHREGDPNEQPGMYRPPPPQRQQSPAEHFRETMGMVRQALALRDELDSVLPDRNSGGGYEPQTDENSPVRVEEVGRIKTIRDNDGIGKMRLWETALLNLPDGVKWFAEQVDKIGKERQRREQPQRRLPHGYVEVPADYQPPPGYVAVQVDPSSLPQEQDDLPPPPENVPPPMPTSTATTPPRTWDIPGSDQ